MDYTDFTDEGQERPTDYTDFTDEGQELAKTVFPPKNQCSPRIVKVKSKPTQARNNL